MIIRKTMGCFIAALCAILPAAAHAEAYCQKGGRAEMYWAGDWLPVTVEGGPDKMGQCLMSGHEMNPSWITREQVRPVGGGTWDDAAAKIPAAKPAAAGAAQAYCKKGDRAEMYWAGDWLPVTVEGGPDKMGQCLMSGHEMNPSWITRERLRPVGGGTFAAAPAAGNAAAVPEAAAAPAPAADAAQADRDRAAYEELMNYDPHKPQPEGNLGALTPGVYMCEQDIIGNDPSAAFGIIDGDTYRNFDGVKGKYKYDDATGVLELVSGGGKGLKYVRTLDTTFRMLKPDGTKTGMNCNLNRSKTIGGRW